MVKRVHVWFLIRTWSPATARRIPSYYLMPLSFYTYSYFMQHPLICFFKLVRYYNIVSLQGNYITSRGGCRGLPLLPMQCPEMAYINFQSSVFVSIKTVNKWTRILNLTESRCERHCSERDAYIGWMIQFFLSRF